ncbi:unnamed protein product [Rotaria socialis]|uniref:Uncharacterized protein n=1 Tax=Rotaria socialis TaxID=392032 RepID=A0A819VFL8_9BILA|nr:unnamed protein product [Rotaria socialis]
MMQLTGIYYCIFAVFSLTVRLQSQRCDGMAKYAACSSHSACACFPMVQLQPQPPRRVQPPRRLQPQRRSHSDVRFIFMLFGRTHFYY